MDVGKLLKNVNNLNEYIAITHDSSEKCKNSRIQLNMSTVLALKKIRSFEIEYVNKCEENGIACVIFERILCLPPSKIFGVLSKELVNLLQYWLDAIRKHLVKHSNHWWSFLKLLLKFMKEIRQKDSSLPNILVEFTGECLLDLATNERPDAMQRYEILHCFNMYCSESSREIRFALRIKFGDYFTKLSTYMCTCGNLPSQYSIMETLLRWLLPRQDRTLRITSASKWFPARMYSDSVVDIFLERPWLNFFQDARDFFNAHNGSSDLIVSVICRKLTVGDIVIISETDKTDFWLDLNSASKSISVLLDPRLLDAFGCTNHKSFETFVISEDNTHTVKLHRESNLLTLSVQTINPPRVLPSCIKLGDQVSCDVIAVITSRCDVNKLDAMLRRIFEDKYQLLLDLEKDVTLSPPKATEQLNKTTEEDPRFSHPVEVRRRKHSGFMVKSHQPLSCMSPSTASTSSLAQLHEKLAALPRYRFDKEPQSVCALPELSIVSEASEADERSTVILNYKPYGVCHKDLNTIDFSRKSQSDNETTRKYIEPSRKAKGRRLSPVVNEGTPSCLLVATIGSADDSVINDTVDRLSKSKDYDPDNIVDLLVQEALNSKLERDKDKIDSGINTGEKKTQELNDNCDAIDNTPNTDIGLSKATKKCSKIVSSTSDESNTEAICDTPNVYVNTRRKKKDIPNTLVEGKIFDVQQVEEFFSQHFTEVRAGEIAISPTLAKKINETSSETTDDCLDANNLVLMGDDFQNLEVPDFNNIEVIECLNNIVDKVCDDFDKYLNDVEETANVDNNSDSEDDLPLKDILNTIQNIDQMNKATAKTPATSKKILLKFKGTTKKDKPKTRITKKKSKQDIKNTPKMSTITEDNAETITECVVIETVENVEKAKKDSLPDRQTTTTTTITEAETSMLRKKRKLFSPKDEQVAQDAPVNSQEDFIESKIKQTPKSSYKPYKEIEKERQRYIRLPRNRNIRKVATPSPRSKKLNDLFDKVKESANGEQVTLAHKASEMYNFSSDSEDDFKEKKIECSRKNSSTTLASEDSTVLKRGRVVKRVNYSSKAETKNSKRKVNRRQKGKKVVEVDVEPVRELVDEKMRTAKDVLETSVVVESPKAVVAETVMVLEKPSQMEAIIELDEKRDENQQRKRVTRKNEAKSADLAKGTKQVLSIKPKDNDDRTVSPLPGLVIEEALTNKQDGDMPANMVDKLKKICQNPEKYINESNTTQNLLSDNERIILSPQNVDITDEFMQFEIRNRDEPKPKEKTVKKKKANSVKAKKTEKKVVPKKAKAKAEVMNISVSDAKSEQSIATIGITGHGDSEEAPPSPKLIIETLQHRNLETEYLDLSTKDYFDKLTAEIDDVNVICHNVSKENKNSNVTSNKSNSRESKKVVKSINSLISKSPVVSIEKISLEDISRWLPSRRNSDTDDSQISNNSKLKNVKSSEKVIEENATNSEDDSDIQEAIRRSLRISPVLETDTKRGDKKTQNENNDTSDTIKSTCVTRAKKIEAKRVPYTRQAKRLPKSYISPIELFDGFIKDADKLSQTTLSDDEDYMNEIKETVSKMRKNEIQTQSSIDESIKEIRSKKSEKELLNKSIHERLTRSTDSEPIKDKMSTSTTIERDHRAIKRKSEEDRDERKKRKEDNSNGGDNSASGITVSSVNDWFKRNEPSCSRTEDVNVSEIQNVLEKLDTTLMEIQQNTSRQLVHLFVTSQQQLSDLKQENEAIFKRDAAELLSSIVQIVDEKFSDMNNRSQDQFKNFMKQLKEQAVAVIREDCKQKRLMVKLLREDVQAVLEHNMRRNAEERS